MQEFWGVALCGPGTPCAACFVSRCEYDVMLMSCHDGMLISRLDVLLDSCHDAMLISGHDVIIVSCHDANIML